MKMMEKDEDIEISQENVLDTTCRRKLMSTFEVGLTDDKLSELSEKDQGIFINLSVFFI
jgi:hypothetical protein